MTEPVVYPPSTLRVDPETLPALRSAIDVTLAELGPHLTEMRTSGHMPEPWLGDSASFETWAFYTDHVMGAPDGPFQALLAYEAQLVAVRDRLVEIQAEYDRTESDTAAVFGSRL
ncbi:hypothetical protein [Pseudonocardia hydrocarbonoxydans]|uniref:hypothetical protein n=1 Tax=Pseudonocardia hydrocarbonoxydans TaxID=76726 RepID=UPI0011447CEC|nr:hypothetical protein [Pseudonocardia hydrocarbonoxydans]